MAEYTMKQLCEIVDRTQSMLYNYIKTDKEYFESHRRKDSKKGFLYDEEALLRIKEKIGVLNGVAWGNPNEEDENIPLDTPPSSLPQEEETKQELERLKEKYAELQAELEKVEAERKQLLEQNGSLLLLLSQEKAEKQKLLPKPRKTIGERIRALFRKNRPSDKSI